MGLWLEKFWALKGLRLREGGRVGFDRERQKKSRG